MATASATSADVAAAAAAALQQKSKFAEGERRPMALILASRRDSDGADVLRSPVPVQ